MNYSKLVDFHLSLPHFKMSKFAKYTGSNAGIAIMRTDADGALQLSLFPG